jgi:acyl carrier protein
MYDDLGTIIEMISRAGGVTGLEPDQDFYAAGFTSVMALPLLMEMEEQFQVSIPDDRFIQARTARALHQVVADLKTD